MTPQIEGSAVWTERAQALDDPDGERFQAECDHGGEFRDYELDDVGPWGCTVTATCVECGGAVVADVEPEEFAGVDR